MLIFCNQAPIIESAYFEVPSAGIKSYIDNHGSKKRNRRDALYLSPMFRPASGGDAATKEAQSGTQIPIVIL